MVSLIAWQRENLYCYLIYRFLFSLKGKYCISQERRWWWACMLRMFFIWSYFEMDCARTLSHIPNPYPFPSCSLILQPHQWIPATCLTSQYGSPKRRLERGKGSYGISSSSSFPQGHIELDVTLDLSQWLPSQLFPLLDSRNWLPLVPTDPGGDYNSAATKAQL